MKRQPLTVKEYKELQMINREQFVSSAVQVELENIKSKADYP